MGVLSLLAACGVVSEVRTDKEDRVVDDMAGKGRQ
jgi:hypothetical protein